MVSGRSKEEQRESDVGVNLSCDGCLEEGSAHAKFGQ